MNNVPSADEFEGLLGEFEEEEGEQETDEPTDEPRRISSPRPPEAHEDVSRNINESADKIQLETQIKRGDDVRDEDRIKVKVKGNDPNATAAKLHQTVLAIGERGTHDTLRDIQASDSDE